MSRIVIIVAALFSFSTCFSQQVSSYKAEDVVARISNTDTFYIVNFWATWCGPCVKELPEFDKMETYFAGKPVKILLVSLDFQEDFPKKVERFIARKKLQHEVVWLNETKANDFIPKIEPAWQGSIPATMLSYHKNTYHNFFEGTVKAKQLIPLIEKQLSYQD